MRSILKMNLLKICTKCQRELDRSLFYKQRTNRDGLVSWCKDCHKQWALLRPERIKESRAKYRAANADKLREKNRQYHHQHADREKERSRQYRRLHPQRVKEYTKKYCADNPERRRETDRRYKRLHPDLIIDRQKKYGAANRKRLNEYRRQVFKRCPEKKASNTLPDSYIKLLLRRNSQLTSAQIPQELIELKRVQLQITRKLKETKK